MPVTPKIWVCLICGKPQPNYVPDHCYDGGDFTCHGEPMTPCVCSDKCYDALIKGIGKPYDQRRIDAGIETWNSAEERTKEIEGIVDEIRALEFRIQDLYESVGDNDYQRGKLGAAATRLADVKALLKLSIIKSVYMKLKE